MAASQREREDEMERLIVCCVCVDEPAKRPSTRHCTFARHLSSRSELIIIPSSTQSLSASSSGAAAFDQSSVILSQIGRPLRSADLPICRIGCSLQLELRFSYGCGFTLFGTLFRCCLVPMSGILWRCSAALSQCFGVKL